MADFLNNYIESLSTRQQRRVSDIFNVAILAKSDVTTLASILTNQVNFGTIVLSTMPQQGLLSASYWQLNIRNINLRFQELFSVANEVGELLAQNEALLTSQVSALEKQISALERQVANYQFLLSDGGTYNYAYLETFHDNLGEDTSVPWQVPDRDGNAFDPVLQDVTILSDEGAIILPDNFATNLALTAQVYATNVQSFITSDTGVSNILSSDSRTGWRVACSAPTPLTAALPDSNFRGYEGAQAIIEVSLGQPQAVNSIKLTPLTSGSVQLVQIMAFSSAQDRTGTPLLSQSEILSQSTSLHFSATNIQRLHIYINQATYTRLTSYSNTDEADYRQLVTSPSPLQQEGYIKFDGSVESSVRLPTFSLASFDQYVPEVIPSLLENRTRVGPADFWRTYSVYDASFYGLFSRWPGIYKTFFSNSVTTASYNASYLGQLTPPSTNVAPTPVTALPDVTASTIQQPQSYEYVFGLQYLGVGIDVPAYKGYFLSNVIGSPGDMGEVQIRVADSNYVSNDATLDNPILTSIEYSVTNESYPVSESDWQPILPADTVSVPSERLFPDKAGNCTFRFTASRGELLTVFKNGHSTLNYSLNFDNSYNNITGVQLLPGTYTANDIMTTSYTPSGTSSVINFTQSGFDNVPLLAAGDTTGSGEGFVGTGGRNTIQLSQVPYVNYSLITSQKAYSPITVVLSDGSLAVNLTNYATNAQSGFPPTAGYYYYQSGNNLIFNQAITQPFRVYYEYIQNNVRLRIVLRTNSVDFVSPKVNYVQLKAQTRLSNTQQSV